MAQPVSASASPSFANWPRWFWPALAATLVLDLASKAVVFALPHARLPFWMEQHSNTGVAWSMLDKHPSFVALLTAVLIPILAWVWWYNYRLAGRMENLAFGMILGGALGNGYDRIAATLGQMAGVRDFIHVDLGFWPLNPWPTFNLADSGISLGFVLLVVLSFARPAPRATPLVS